MTLDQIFTVFIISTIISVFSYFFWGKNIDKLIQTKLFLLKQEMKKNNEDINRKLKKIELDIQRNRNKENDYHKIKKGRHKNVDRNN